MDVSTLVRKITRTRNVGSETHPNHEGAPSYYRPLREQVVQVLSTGTLGNTFYCSGERLAREAVDVLLKAREECPEFLARALVYARQQGLMRALPVLGLVVLSGGRGKTRNLFESVFNRVILIPDDLRYFVALCRSGKVPGRDGFGGAALKMAKQWLEGISEYHALKYGSTASREITLRDILRLTHAKPSEAAVAERFGWLVRGASALGSNPELNPQIRALEALKRAETFDEQSTLIREGRLPFEVVIPSLRATTPAIWAELLHIAPYGNLLRSLVTFARHGVFQSEANVQRAVEKLTDPRAVEHSRVLPFRFFDAWQAYQRSENCDTRIADAIRAALEFSFVNMPSLGDRVVALGTDVSGSMEGQISDKGSTRFIDIAGVFTGALMRRIGNRAIPLPFDTCAHPNCGLSSRDDIMVTAERIAGFGGGGTAIGSPVEYLLNRQIKVDAFIGITDQVDWAYGEGYSCSDAFLPLWQRYRQEVAPDARAFLVTIAPYRDAVAPVSSGVSFIYGWSDQVLRYISLELEGGASQTREIEQMELTDLADRNNGTHSDTDEGAQDS